MKKFTLRKSIRVTAFFYVIAVSGTLLLVNACKKNGGSGANGVTTTTTTQQATKHPAQTSDAAAVQGEAQLHMVTVANLRPAADGGATEVMFNELAEIFTVSDPTMIANLKSVFARNLKVQVSVDPWRASVEQVNMQTTEAAPAVAAARTGASGTVIDMTVSHTAPEIDAMAVINTTSGTLVNVIPDMATAQHMFDYILHQCCQLPGPYAIDYCIPFQYCPDGCYARAHKMCWIINNKYNYATHKIFSFANAGSDRLSVKAQKWGGCCVTWWYHVAPLVNIKTPTGVKAYVFDPAMFDQPVPLSSWLHWQENPACSGTANVSMINIQPTSSYSPSSYSGYTFSTDPSYSATNSTLNSYRYLTTCH